MSQELKGFSKHINFQIFFIIIKIFLKINKESKENNEYYEKTMDNLLNNGLSEETIDELDANSKKYEDKGILSWTQKGYWLNFCSNNNFSTNVAFILEADKLILKYKLMDMYSKKHFQDMLNRSKIKKDLYVWFDDDDDKSVWTLTINNFKAVFKKIYLYCIKYWIDFINKNADVNEKAKTFQYFIKYFRNYTKRQKLNKICNTEIFYTTNYFNVPNAEYFANFSLYSDEQTFAVYPEEKDKLASEKLENIEKEKFDNEEYEIRELNIFGLDIRMDTKLIEKLIDMHEINKIKYWVHGNKMSYWQDQNINDSKKHFQEFMKQINEKLEDVGKGTIKCELSFTNDEIYKNTKT